MGKVLQYIDSVFGPLRGPVNRGDSQRARESLGGRRFPGARRRDNELLRAAVAPKASALGVVPLLLSHLPLPSGSGRVFEKGASRKGAPFSIC